MDFQREGVVSSEDLIDWAKIGERLRQIRKKSRLSQREFGRQFGISQNMISLYEKGKSRASVEFYMRVAQLGGRTIEWLLTGQEDQTLETLREMRELHEKMKGHLAVVRELLERQAEDTLDQTILPLENPEQLREILRAEKNLPPCLAELLEDPSAWQAMAMNGREVYALRRLTELFGDIGREEVPLFLRLVRRATKSPQPT